MNPKPARDLGPRAVRLSHPPRRKSRVCTEISVEDGMVDTPMLAASATALILGVVCVFLWRNLAGSRRAVHRLREQIAHLETERSSRPSLRVTFEFTATGREALLHVTNDGGDAVVWAPMSVEGALSQQVEGDLRAVWRNETASTVMLPHGETRTLRLAQLDLSVFPYAQWEIFVAGPAKTGHYESGHYESMRAMHTSMIGGNPDTHAPTMFIQVALFSSPECAGQPPHSTIALQPFEAVRLRPV